ncbi:carboxypeptidase-like regulatory domain-containing protein [Flavobacterium rhizosphaerae]|uniref:Carboxypeptidase-like regulatory domain-containing protein n=1 Tax=Flavobacterium rhizosphaerae TaxID=3163298 RepID=A0ABW8YTK6_9FLAO
MRSIITLIALQLLLALVSCGSNKEAETSDSQADSIPQGESSTGEQEFVTFRGTIIDNEGAPVPGVTLMDESTDEAVITDINGKFELLVPKDSEISINNLGYDNFSLNAEEASNAKINIEQRIITFCCTNHTKIHCSSKRSELQELAETKGCIFN